MMKISHKKLNVIIIIISCIFIISIIINNWLLHKKYQQEIIDNNIRIIANLVSNNPELEEDIIDSLIEDKGDLKLGNKILTKYGLDNYKNLNELPNNKQLKKSIIFSNALIILIAISSYLIIIYCYKRNVKRSTKEINEYVELILMDKELIEFKDYDTDLLDTLKNDIYKMTIKLRNLSEYSMKEKKYLETTLSDISHQLKTPLTSLFVFNDILNNDELDNKKRKEIVQKSSEQLDRIKWLITSLLKMSQLDSGSVKLLENQIDLKEIITKAIAPFEISLELKNIKVDIDIPNRIKLLCDENWTIEALSNIIKNAYEHTDKNGVIKISAEDNPIYTRLYISDNGQGIKKEDLQHIFKRFYHGNANKESIGIGLNMTKMIINKQKGDIEVKSKLNEGTTFIITFYKHK